MRDPHRIAVGFCSVSSVSALLLPKIGKLGDTADEILSHARLKEATPFSPREKSSAL